MPSRTRLGRLNGVTLSILGSLVLLAALIWTLQGDREDGADVGELTLYCAAGLKPPVEAVAREYEEQYGVHINIIYGGSGTLLSNIKIAGFGDLYLPADESYCKMAQSEDLCREMFPLAKMTPVVGVKSGNPKGIVSVSDLLGPEVNFGIASPKATAAGRRVRDALTKSGQWDEVREAATKTSLTVMDLANDLSIGALDAGLVWDSTVNQFAGLESIHLPELDGSAGSVTICVLESSEAPTAALRFCRYLSSRDIGAPHFIRMGYEPVEGDPWAKKPELELYCGAMLSEAIDDTIAEFEQREGVGITRVYNGCGLLVAQMDAGASPDAYFSCDQSFLDVVSEKFHPGTTVSSNRVVILVREGNPRGVQGLADLCMPDLIVGLAHPEKSALGKLTVEILEEEDLAERLRASGNVLTKAATGHMLVNQIRVGSLDAVVVYRSNASLARDETDIIPIPNQGAQATQPFAIAREAKYPRINARLLNAFTRKESQARFAALGFGWERPSAPESE
jgi:ABC-type molybdate transport system substrate-binding protein